jgi:hypothetical protein
MILVGWSIVIPSTYLHLERFLDTLNIFVWWLYLAILAIDHRFEGTNFDFMSSMNHYSMKN